MHYFSSANDGFFQSVIEKPLPFVVYYNYNEITVPIMEKYDLKKGSFAMAKYRRNRINDAVAQETADIIRDIKDPRVSTYMITVTGADVTGDLKYAKVFYSFLDDAELDAEAEKELRRGPFVRRELAVRLNMRITPEITFVRDKGVSHGAEIASLLNSIKKTEPDADTDEETDDEL